MDKLERSCEFPVDLGGDMVGHPACVLDGVKPVVTWHLCFGEICLRHGAHGGTHTLQQVVLGLSAGGGTIDLGFLEVDPEASLTP